MSLLWLSSCHLVRATSFAKLPQQSHSIYHIYHIYHIYGGSLLGPVRAESSGHPCHSLSWKIKISIFSSVFFL